MTQQPSQGCPFTGKTDSLTRRYDRLLSTTELSPNGNLTQAQSYADGRDLLKDGTLAQAGFLADTASQARGMQHPPVLYMQGDEHTEMRRATARYFTPTAVGSYGPKIGRAHV